ncbi:type II toxin-antitoxin system RelE/ParE family toxin [Rhodothermus sp. AH-315-K08]|nr:type II toxin-antitoxin system RelE/ParE family toxin [Rhodothermus sp. AH-315-K08]
MYQFLEWEGFRKRRKALLTDEEYRTLQNVLLENPRVGQVMPRTGGFGRIRVKRGGGGKRGGFRVIYYCHEAPGVIHLLMLFAKNEQTKLTADQERVLKGLAMGIKVRKE